MIAPPAIPVRRPPHRPFRDGAPRFAPALQPIEPAAWLTPDSEAHVLDWKGAMLDAPEAVHRAMPEAASATRDAAASISETLGADPTDDLIAASRLVSDDLVVMIRGDAGWRCAALTLTAPTFFAIDAVIARDVAALHDPVPDAARLAARIDRVFDGVRPGQILERFNWTLQPGPERFTPDAAPLRERASRRPAPSPLEALHLRVERQTITKLRRTGAVLFTIRVCLDPLTHLAEEDRSALAAAWRGLGPQGRAYKGWAAYEPLAEAAFATWRV